LSKCFQVIAAWSNENALGLSKIDVVEAGTTATDQLSRHVCLVGEENVLRFHFSHSITMSFFYLTMNDFAID
jgi:hypothetical protein